MDINNTVDLERARQEIKSHFINKFGGLSEEFTRAKYRKLFRQDLPVSKDRITRYCKQCKSYKDAEYDFTCRKAVCKICRSQNNRDAYAENKNGFRDYHLQKVTIQNELKK